MKFEDNLKKLEELVARMESGEMKLDDMIAAFEEGRRLKDACQKLYGKGADAMLAYYQALANASKACSADSHAWAAPNPASVYTQEQVKKIDATIATAKSMLSKVSELERQRMQNQIDLWEKAKTYF